MHSRNFPGFCFPFPIRNVLSNTMPNSCKKVAKLYTSYRNYYILCVCEYFLSYPYLNVYEDTVNNPDYIESALPFHFQEMTCYAFTIER